MRQTEKKMKQYTRAVQRRLNLPRSIRERVMSDFLSDIEARRENGMTDDQICQELGSPKKAAAELNEQMKEFAYRKSPWRYVFAALAAYGGAELLSRLWVDLICLGVEIWDHFSADTMAVSIGIIGGADGPTAIFVTGPEWSQWIVPILLLTVGIWGFLRLSRCKQRRKEE